MKHILIVTIFAIASIARADNPRAYFAPDVRLVVSLNVKQLAAAPLAKAGGPIKDFMAALQKTCTPFGIDAAKQLDRIWLVCGEDYPKGTLLFLQGKYDPTRVAVKFQDLVRDRKYAARVTRENNQNVLYVEVPVAANPIPGLPAGVFMSVAGTDAIVVAFDKATLLAALARKTSQSERPASLVEPHLDKLKNDASFSAVMLPPAALTVPQAVLTGAKLVDGTIQFETGLASRWTITLGEDQPAKALADRWIEGLKQSRELFPPLAAQQGIDPQLTAWINAALAALRVEARPASVEVTLDLNKEALTKPLEK